MISPVRREFGVGEGHNRSDGVVADGWIDGKYCEEKTNRIIMGGEDVLAT